MCPGVLRKHLALFLKSHNGTGAGCTLKFFKTSNVILIMQREDNTRSRIFIEELTEKGTCCQLVCDRHFQIEPPSPSSLCKPRLGSPHFPDEETRCQNEEATYLKAATDYHLSGGSTPVSASLWQGPRLTNFNCSSTTRINKLDTSQENKGIMRLHKARVIKKALITAHKHDSFSIELQRQGMKRSQMT